MTQIIVSLILALAAMPITLGRSNNEGARIAQCSLTRDQSPEISGFRLGTSLEQVLARFPGLMIQSDIESAIELVFVQGTSDSLNRKDVNPLKDKAIAYVNRSKFAGFDDVSSLYLRFLGGRITLIEVRYNGATKWNTVDEFVARVSEALGLPNRWQPVLDVSDRLHDKRVLECVGFRAIANVKPECALPGFCGPGPAESQVTLGLQATAVAQSREQLQRQKKEQERREEEKRKIFKP